MLKTLLATVLLAAPLALAQPKPLRDVIAQQDKLMFDAFNAHDADTLETFFTPDLEFYHDKGGLSDLAGTMKGLSQMFSRNDGVRRELVGAMEVYPIGEWGAVEIAAHRFCHKENGKDDCGTFKFVHVWQKKDGGKWQVRRVISYDH